MLALLAEDKVTLFGFGDDEVELHLFSQHGGREREGVEGGVGHLRLQRTKLGRVSSQLASFQAAHLKMVIDRGQLSWASTSCQTWLCRQSRKRQTLHLLEADTRSKHLTPNSLSEGGAVTAAENYDFSPS